MENINPFWHGTPVPPEKLINRQRELRTTTGRIITGQSTAISGAPRSGKTSLLNYLMAPEKQTELYGAHADRLIFSYLDAQLWDTQFDILQFWRVALLSLQEHITADSPLAKAYQNCQDNAFSNDVLEKLLIQLKKENKQLVLMIDGIEGLLPHPLNKGTFWGGLRILASRSQEALVVIITANISVDELHGKIRETTGVVGGSASAYFNFMEEIILGPLADGDVSTLLGLAGNCFTEDDKRFIKTVAGGYPYLLQMVASILYDDYQNEKETDSISRQQRVKQVFYEKVASTLKDIWGSWSSPLQGAFISVALTQLKALRNVFKKPEFDIDKITQRVESGYKAQLDYLKSHGFLIVDRNVPSGWRVYPSIFLPFVLMTRLKPEYREKVPKEIWNNLFAPRFGEN